MWKATAKTETKGIIVEATSEDSEPATAARDAVYMLEEKLEVIPSIVENMDVKLEWLP